MSEIIRSKTKTSKIIWILLCLMPVIGMAVDLVAPSLPSISNNLHASNELVKNLISIYIFGYAFGNFFTGFLTDAWGRRHLILFNLLFFFVVSLIPVLTPNIYILLVARFLQGMTLGATAVIARAIFADILPAEQLIRLGTLIGTMWGLGPVIGPIIGGYLQAYYGWKAGFYFLSSLAFIAFIFIYKMIPETHHDRHPLHFTIIKNNILIVLSNKLFVIITILMGLAYSLIIIFNTAGPFLIQNQFKYSPIFYGHVGLGLGLVFLFSTFACRVLLKIFQFEKLFTNSIYIFFLITIIGLTAAYFFQSSVDLTVAVSALMYLACGFIFPMSMGKGLSLFRHIAGTAGATMYLINMLITSLVSFFVSFIHVQNNMNIFFMYFIVLLLSATICWRFNRKL